ncbi:hypothetical protein PENTCL1PPCAC_26511, partial [Pristionchus entomophagus]
VVNLPPSLVLLPLPPLPSSTVCQSQECKETSNDLFASSTEKDACTDHYIHACTSEERKKRENAEKLKADELTKKDRRLFVEYLEKMKDSNDSILSGMRRLNESCMNFKGNLSDSLLDLLDKMLEEDQRKNEEGNPVKV